MRISRMNRTLTRLALAAATAATIAVAATPAFAHTATRHAAGDQPAAASAGRHTHTPTVASLPRYVMWDAASDFGITATNPQPDSYGDANVWSFLQGGNLQAPSTFTRLATYTTTQFGVHGLDSWQGPVSSQPNDFLPQVGINVSAAIADGSTSTEMAGIYWPKKALLVHPDATSDAIIGWTSPVSMTVTVAAAVTKLDRACGSGITWRLANGSQRLASGSLTNTSSPQGAVRTLAVSAGTRIYLEIGPAANHDFTCDSTGVSLTITGQTH